ncbi:DUF349 domain-containing protein [Gracilimonas mengyeensis]|uniref:DUF349 domain-containing protein n=1 Tax=Gracilimonas mengyeensis TaxID=1302730 RepID=A0A521BT03_9BACT|nr:DUF349 domain-containing protein [Gracilimonas mengyeensis]SMO49700.1 protein of unknown function [Gracilimonas mengyeensis]
MKNLEQNNTDTKDQNTNAEENNTSAGEEKPTKQEEVTEETSKATDESVTEDTPVEEEAAVESEEKQQEAPEAETAEESAEEESAEAADAEEAEEESAESEDVEASEEEGDGEAEESEVDAESYYEEIVERAKELVVQTDWTFVTTELANLAQQVADGPESVSDKASKLIDEFNELREGFEEKKRKHYEEQNRRKEENLARKKELLKELSDIVSEEKWTATREVGKIRGKWDSIKLLPQGEAEALDKRYNELLAEFEDHKVDRLVKKLQKEEENLELKLLLLDKMDSLANSLSESTSNFSEMEDKFNKLISQWRKVGRVPSDKNQGLWDRFNAVQDRFNELRFKFDKKYREKIEKALDKKKNLVKEAEALVDMDNIAKAARKVNKLHKAWKKAGNLPQKEENEMWDKFKAATDAFNQKKSDNIDVLREQEEKNLDKKHELIEKASEIKDTDDFDKGHQIMQDLMKKWKKIGPVPRKKSSKIWKKFKGEMDVFYDRRREAFKGRREDQKENLEKKQEILKKLEELGSHDDPALAVQEAKELQQEFKDIGYVPIKMKNKIWKQYREACDVIYDRYRALGSDLGMEKKLASQGVDPDDRKKVIKYRKESDKLKKEVSKLESEVIQYEEAQTYFKPTNKGSALRDELQDKIDKAESSIEEKNDRIKYLEKEIDLIKNNSADLDDEEDGDEEE